MSKTKTRPKRSKRPAPEDEPVMLLRNSERMSFKRCRWQWNWNFNDLLKPIEEAPALKFGDLVHQALAVYYKPGIRRGPRPAVTFEKLYEAKVAAEYAEGFRDEDGDWHEAGDLGVRMLERHYDLYHERDKQWKVLGSEAVFQWPVRVKVPGWGWQRFHVVGTVDGICQDRSDRDIFWLEHKTTKAIATDALAMDEQAGTYWTYGPAWMRAHGILKEDQEPSHIKYNFLRKWAPNPDDTYDAAGFKLNKDGSRSKNQPAPAFKRWPVYRDEADKRNMHERVKEEFTDIFLIRKGERAIYKNPGPLFMPNCRGCPFRDMCELHETGQDWESYRDASMTTWDPYSAHEIIERH